MPWPRKHLAGPTIVTSIVSVDSAMFVLPVVDSLSFPETALAQMLRSEWLFHHVDPIVYTLPFWRAECHSMFYALAAEL